MTKRGVFFDGDRPEGVPVTLSLPASANQLRMTPAEGDDIDWPIDQIRRIPDHAGTHDTMLRITSDPLARLYVPQLADLPRWPHIDRADPPKGRGRLALWAAGAVAAVAIQIGVLIPILADQLAVVIPRQAEHALGEATFQQIRNALGSDAIGPLGLCENPAGVAALTAMSDRLSATLPDAADINVFVLDHPMINAFALPGGFVVFFRGLIDAAETPEEVAAVFAHEMGHVVGRDPTRNALRSAGSIGVLGLLFGDFAGGAVVLFLTERLIDAQYSQAAETGADTFAYDVLERAEISPAALGDMFQRLRDEHGDQSGVLAHFLTHPTLSDRIDRARAAAPDDVTWQPVLTPAQWNDLQNICD
ncbi:M48 family metallopeptidase [uncultured Tateyamaria sp.]|uniref:M48 family metallopeptidase n=1 Tax=uncultured Tateyamaria sp. TaxID=455651 RepID=UPI0026104A5E|nr:M48 family metallopeptidase [uncultured Tateyamaria sp.]